MIELQQQHIQELLLLLRAFGPAKPTPTNYARSAVSFYSSEDHITLPLSMRFFKDPNYDIKVLPCISPRSSRIGHVADHTFLAPTYQGALQDQLKKLREGYGFYDGKVR